MATRNAPIGPDGSFFEFTPPNFKSYQSIFNFSFSEDVPFIFKHVRKNQARKNQAVCFLISPKNMRKGKICPTFRARDSVFYFSSSKKLFNPPKNETSFYCIILIMSIFLKTSKSGIYVSEPCLDISHAKFWLIYLLLANI